MRKILVALVLTLSVAAAGSADPIKVNFTATVTDKDDSGLVPGRPIELGDSFTGAFTFDPLLPQLSTATVALSLPIVFESGLVLWENDLEFPTNTISDLFQIIADARRNPFNLLLVFNDPTARALQRDAPPRNIRALNRFPAKHFIFETFSDEGPIAAITGTLDLQGLSAPTPEPASLTLLLLGLPLGRQAWGLRRRLGGLAVRSSI